MPETIIDPYTEENCCTCIICGGHRVAFCSPPVCGEDCRRELETECDFNRIAQEEIDGTLDRHTE